MRTVSDFIRLMRRAGSYAVHGCQNDLSPAQDITVQHGSTPLGMQAQSTIWKIMPILLGNQPECEAAVAEEAAKPWIGDPVVLRKGLEEIASSHDLGGIFINPDRDGVWVPSGLFGWLPQLPVPIVRKRWAIVPDFPVPVHQVLLRLAPISTALARGDLRPILSAENLADLRVLCAPWASTWGRPGMGLGEILAIGGHDALAASAVVMLRGSQSLDGWHELRGALGIVCEPGWVGYVLEFFGAPSAEQRLLHPARHAWLTGAFERSESCFG